MFDKTKTKKKITAKKGNAEISFGADVLIYRMTRLKLVPAESEVTDLIGWNTRYK